MASARSSFPPLALLIRSPLLPWPTPTVSRHTPPLPEGPRHPHTLLLPFLPSISSSPPSSSADACCLITLFTRGTSRPINLDEPEEAYTIDIFFSRFACNLKPWIQDHIFFCLSDVAMGQKRPRCRQLRLRPEDIEIGSPRRTKLGTHCL